MGETLTLDDVAMKCLLKEVVAKMPAFELSAAGEAVVGWGMGLGRCSKGPGGLVGVGTGLGWECGRE